MVTCEYLTTAKRDRIKNYMELVFNYDLFQGSVLIAKKDKILLNKGYGYADSYWRTHATSETKYMIGSISKQFTAMIILQLVQENKINLDAPIADYLPDYRKDMRSEIRIHHLLTNTSGLINYTKLPNFWDNTAKIYYSKEEFYKHYCMLDRIYIPGKKYDYCNTNFNLLSYMAEKITGKNYSSLLREKIFSPLKMRNSGIYNIFTNLVNFANVYNYEGPGPQRLSYSALENIQGACNIFSTVTDLYKWNQAIMSNTLLNKKLMEKMFTPHAPIEKGGYYGYGVVISFFDKNTKIIEHLGTLNGFRGYNMICPEKAISITMLANNGIQPMPIAHNIFKLLLGLKYEDISIPFYNSAY